MAYHRPRLPTRHQARHPHAMISPRRPTPNEHRQNIRHTGGNGSCGWTRLTDLSNALIIRPELTLTQGTRDRKQMESAVY